MYKVGNEQLSLKEAAGLIGVTAQSLSRWIKSGTCPFGHWGGGRTFIIIKHQMELTYGKTIEEMRAVRPPMTRCARQCPSEKEDEEE